MSARTHASAFFLSVGGEGVVDIDLSCLELQVRQNLVVFQVEGEQDIDIVFPRAETR